MAEVLRAHGVKYVFTLVGGHISPILVACEKVGIRIVDTRHEATAVFAADAVARLSGADFCYKNRCVNTYDSESYLKSYHVTSCYGEYRNWACCSFVKVCYWYCKQSGLAIRLDRII